MDRDMSYALDGAFSTRNQGQLVASRTEQNHSVRTPGLAFYSISAPPAAVAAPKLVYDDGSFRVYQFPPQGRGILGAPLFQVQRFQAGLTQPIFKVGTPAAQRITKGTWSVAASFPTLANALNYIRANTPHAPNAYQSPPIVAQIVPSQQPYGIVSQTPLAHVVGSKAFVGPVNGFGDDPAPGGGVLAMNPGSYDTGEGDVTNPLNLPQYMPAAPGVPAASYQVTPPPSPGIWDSASSILSSLTKVTTGVLASQAATQNAKSLAQAQTALANARARAPASSGMPSWVMPVAVAVVGIGALVLLKGRK